MSVKTNPESVPEHGKTENTGCDLSNLIPHSSMAFDTSVSAASRNTATLSKFSRSEPNFKYYGVPGDGKWRVFTLVELLLTISIIAILSSMLLPALGQARRTAHQISCNGNLRQMGTATHSYLSDYDYYPRAWQSATSRWVDQLTPYSTKTSEFYSCPEDPVKEPSAWDASISLSYGINVSKFSNDNAYCFWYHVKGGRVRSVARTIFIADCEPGKYFVGSGLTYPPSYVEYRHKNRTFNALFCDGHVADLRQEEATAELWDARQ